MPANLLASEEFLPEVSKAMKDDKKLTWLELVAIILLAVVVTLVMDQVWRYLVGG